MRSLFCLVLGLMLGCSVTSASPTLQPFSPWSPGNSYTVYGHFVSAEPISNTTIPAPSPSDVVIAVDVVNKVWFFGQYDSTGALVQGQWALPKSSFILQGGVCYPRSGWNYDHQRVGFSYLAEFDSDLFGTEISIAGPAYDIASCDCEEVASMEMVHDVFGRGYALKTWFFAQAFNFITGGVQGVLYFDRFIFGQPDSALIALPSSCPTSGAPDYCAIFTPPTCVILPNPTL